jgi:hypothetical protein
MSQFDSSPPRLRKRWLPLLALVLLLLRGVAAAATPPPLAAPALAVKGIKVTPIGSPTWQPVDFQLFAAPIGTPASGYAEFGATLESLLPPPNHAAHPQLGIGPGAPHAPPYDAELSQNVRAAGYRSATRFSSAEFSGGMGVFLAWMNVPAPGVTGSSPDFAAGPIIPNSLFPFDVTVSTYRNKQLFSATGEFQVPPLDANLDPPFAVDGHSHFPFFYADAADFALDARGKLRGSYNYDVRIVDASGSGWQVQVHFALAP